MDRSPDTERLMRLRAELNQSLSAFLRRTGLLTPKSKDRGEATNASDGLAEPIPSTAARRVERATEAVSVSVDLKGGTIFLDDERRVRALAKEIKRLITEDSRRGLGVGN